MKLTRYMTFALCLLVTASVRPATALGPEEIAVLVNADSKASCAVAREYVKLRQIPAANVIALHFPVKAESERNTLTPAEFTDSVWKPVCAMLKQRGLNGHILAWVYSVDTPIRVMTSPTVSIHGATFLKNDFSSLTRVTNGTYNSPLFAGPNTPGGPAYGSQSLDALAAALGRDTPIPAMSLGYIGERGNSVDAVLASLRSGLASDGTRPTGTVYFVTSGDIRSTCRAWEFPATCQELAHMGVRAVVTNRVPEHALALGVMMGEAVVHPEQFRFVPGAMAEHLTSSAGVFESSDQTKLTAWIDAGAVASAGTVTEPLAMWMKFPHARFFVHYAAGCTVLESFYQAICSPAQLFIVGDPLAQPWKPKATVRVAGIKSPIQGAVEWQTTVDAPTGDYRKIGYFLDGRLIGKGPTFSFDSKKYSNGAHQLHVVAVRTGAVRTQAMTVYSFTIENP